MKSKTIAVTLALVLGGTGAHLFYLRSPVMGFLWISALILNLYLVSGNGWPIAVILSFAFVGMSVIHGLWMAFMSEESFNAEYNAELARCPECSEVIQRAARKCKHCGASIEAVAPWIKPQPKVAAQDKDISYLVR